MRVKIDPRLVQTLGSRKWRMNNLYKIIDKNGKLIPLKPNTFQTELLGNLWHLNDILKARQLGISTIIEILFLDIAVFTKNKTLGIIDWTENDAIDKLNKCRIAYKNLPQVLQDNVKLITDNEKEMEFSNGSRILADTSFRGSTLQGLHVSEYAKVCKRDPAKAREIKTGAINAVAPRQLIFIESTAEGSEGDFFELTKRAEALKISEAKLTEMDYKFFFFPWYAQPEYFIKSDEVISSESEKYFASLEVKLKAGQKAWYCKKKEDLGEDIYKEFPSTSKEAFLASDKDKYYVEEFRFVRANHRITEFEIDKSIPVDFDFDLGRDDYTAVIATQLVGKELRIVDYIEAMGEPIDFYTMILRDLADEQDFKIGTLWLPHDSKAETIGAEKSVYNQLAEAGFKCQLIPRLDIQVGINEARKLLKSCWFRKSKSGLLVKRLESYSKKWSEQLGKYMGPKHDDSSHAADAFRGLATRFHEPEVATSRIKKKEPKKMRYSFGSAGYF